MELAITAEIKQYSKEEREHYSETFHDVCEHTLNRIYDRFNNFRVHLFDGELPTARNYLCCATTTKEHLSTNYRNDITFQFLLLKKQSEQYTKKLLWPHLSLRGVCLGLSKLQNVLTNHNGNWKIQKLLPNMIRKSHFTKNYRSFQNN